ncbi:MAG: protein kinase [Tatlockia sp.]|nr:protein kinase [Tatlockia sp.]
MFSTRENEELEEFRRVNWLIKKLEKEEKKQAEQAEKEKQKEKQKEEKRVAKEKLLKELLDELTPKPNKRSINKAEKEEKKQAEQAEHEKREEERVAQENAYYDEMRRRREWEQWERDRDAKKKAEKKFRIFPNLGTPLLEDKEGKRNELFKRLEEEIKNKPSVKFSTRIFSLEEEYLRWAAKPTSKLILSLRSGCLDKFKETMKKNSLGNDFKDEQGNTLLHLAVKEEKCSEIINWLLAENPPLIFAKNQQDETPLLVAVMNNCFDMALYLIEKGADANEKTIRAKMTLIIARRQISFKEKQFTTIHPEHSIQTRALAGANFGEEEAIGKDKIDSELKDYYYQRLAKAMVGMGDGVNEIWNFIKHFDAQANAIFYRSLILELQLFIASQDEKENKGSLEDKLFRFLNQSTDLTEVSAIKIMETCDRLLQPKIDSLSQQPVGYVLSEAVQWLSQEGFATITGQNSLGNTALLEASSKGKLYVVQWLLKEGGAVITERNKNNNTALLFAARGGRLDVVQWLLNKGGAVITEENIYGNTALLLAAGSGNLGLVQWLLKEGKALITDKNKKGNTVLLLAAESGNLGVVQWLLMEGDFIFTKEEIGLVRERGKNSVNLWLNFYIFLSTNPSLPLTSSVSLAQILSYTGKDKTLLLDKSLFLLFSLYDSPQMKALGLALYQLHVQELQPLLNKSQQQIIQRVSDEINTTLDFNKASTQTQSIQNTNITEVKTNDVELDFEKNLDKKIYRNSEKKSAELKDDVNTAYEYEDNDITAILNARLAELKTQQLLPEGIYSLAAIDNFSGQPLLENCLLAAKVDQDAYIILIPCNLGGGHWTGIGLEFNAEGKIIRQAYIDSLDCSKPPLSFVAQLQKIYPNQALRVRHLLKQDDVTSCGAYVIENLLLFAQNLDADNRTTIDIRKEHLQCLYHNRNNFYEDFYTRQKNNRPTVADISEQGQYHIKPISFSPQEVEKIKKSREIIDRIINKEFKDRLLNALKSDDRNDVGQALKIVRTTLREIVQSKDKEDEITIKELIKNLFFKNPEMLNFDSNQMIEISQSYDFSLGHEAVKEIANCKIIETRVFVNDTTAAKTLEMEEKNTFSDVGIGSAQTPLMQSAGILNVTNEQQPELALDQKALIRLVESNQKSNQNEPDKAGSKAPKQQKLSNDEKHLIKVLLKQITTPDLFPLILKEAFSERFHTNSSSHQDKSLLPEHFNERIKKAFENISDKSLYEQVMLDTSVLMYKLMHNCQPGFLPSFLGKITMDLRGDKKNTVFYPELNHWREHLSPTEEPQASGFQKAVVTLLKLNSYYKPLFEFPKQKSKGNHDNIFINARESIEENVLALVKQRAPSIVHSWLTEGRLNDLKSLLVDPALALRAFLFSTRREAFVKRHPCGPDDNKVPSYYQKVIEQFELNKRAPYKIAFIVVAHFVHTLPYFLETVSSLGEVAALISKQSGTVKSVRKSILEIYQDIIVPNLDKKNLKENATQAESFFSKLFQQEKWKEYRFIILDHGGYFAPRINDVLKQHKHRIAGVVEHTWNGEVRYQEQLERHHAFPFPVFSVAHSTLKGLESEAVANSIVDALTGKIFTGEGVSQTIYTLEKILIIGYGNIGKAVAIALKNRLRNRSKDVICICDTSDSSIKEAERKFSKVTKDKREFLNDADLIITATSTLVLTKEDFSMLKAGAFIACATSSDDQFTEEAIQDYVMQQGPTKQVQSLCPKYKHKNSEKYFHLIANGDSVNFTIGSTPHPIIHIVLTSIAVDAHQLIQNDVVWNHKQINLYIEQDELIKSTYEQTFGRIAADESDSNASIHGRKEKIQMKGTIPLQTIPYNSLEIGDLLGHGGYGDVYKATWHGSAVALKELHMKILSTTLQDEFNHESQIMAQCQFPQIVGLYGICDEVGHKALVMEYMPKGSLRSVLDDKGEEILWDRRWTIAVDIGKGLTYLHEKGIVHRDLKSPNILLDVNYRAKIGDFGLSKIKRESSSITKSNKAVGTARWMAPELLSFENPSSPTKASDVYSYGMVLWEISARELPFKNAPNEMVATMWIANKKKETIPSECPKVYGDIIEDTWLEAENRPGAEEIVTKLTQAKSESLTTKAKQKTDPIPLGPSPQEKLNLAVVSHPIILNENDLPGKAAYMHGRECYLRGQYIEALFYFEVTKENYPAAYLHLGIIYGDGKGVPKDIIRSESDYKKASTRIDWFKDQAETGSANAQFNLGLCYERGIGVPQDDKKAAEYFQKAADPGYADAQYALGVCYANGIGVPQDDKKAVEYYKKAADQGHTAAKQQLETLYNLGVCYANGISVSQDEKKAAEYYKKAPDQGHTAAKQQLETLSKQKTNTIPLGTPVNFYKAERRSDNDYIPEVNNSYCTIS